jgi:multiple sugar transport system substrate-binding protein
MTRRILYALAIVVIGMLVLGVLFFDRLPGLWTERPGPRRVFFADNISPAHEAIIARFNDLHRGRIEVVPVNLPFTKFSTNERKELLARSLRTRSDRIDVFAVDLIWVTRFSKWAEPMDRHFPPESLAATLPRALESCTVGGSLVALPLYLDVGLLYYRSDIIRRLPDAPAIEEALRRSISWDELIALRDRLRYQGRPFYVFQGKAYEGLICNYFEHVASYGPEAVPRDSFPLQSAAARAAVTRLVGLVRDSRASPPAVVDYDEIRSYYAMLDSDAVFVRGWPNFLESFRSLYPDTAKLNLVRIAALPHERGGQAATVFGGWNLMVANSSANKDAAVEFVRFTQSVEAQKLLLELGGYIPVNTRIYGDSAYMAAYPTLRFTSRLIERGVHRPSLEDYTRVSDIVSLYINRALRGEIPPARAGELAAEAIRANRTFSE